MRLDESEALRFGYELTVAVLPMLPEHRLHFLVDAPTFLCVARQHAKAGNPWAARHRRSDLEGAFDMLLWAGLGFWRGPTYRSFEFIAGPRMHRYLVEDYGEDLDARAVVRAYLRAVRCPMVE